MACNDASTPLTQGGARGVDQGFVVKDSQSPSPRRHTTPGVPLGDVLRIDCEFGHVVTIGDLSRSFAAGSLYGVAGANGSGKSTLLLTVAGELEPITATVQVNRVDPGSQDGAGRVARIAEPVFYPDLFRGRTPEIDAPTP